MEIVHAYARHLSLLVSVFDDYRRFYGQPSDPASARQFLADRLERRDSVIFFASQGSGSRQVALGFTQLYPSFSSVWMRRIWILNDLFVTPHARRQGIGKRLIERAVQLAAETRARGLALATAHDNAPAQALYERIGFVLDEEFRYYFLDVPDEAAMEPGVNDVPNRF